VNELKPGGRLAANVMHFGRVLRAAGMPVGTDRIQLALQALQVAGIESRRDFHAVLSTCFIDRAGQRELFDQAFQLFWRDPDLLGRALAMRLPSISPKRAPNATALPAPSQRLASALQLNLPQRAPQDAPERIELDASLTWSERELLHKADFETMTPDEWRAAQRALRRMRLIAEPITTRRAARAPHPGRVDWRATMSAMARHGGELWDMRWKRPRTRPAPLVVLADISGSMSRYSRMLLHFAHTLAATRMRVESFVFGTRLTRITHLLRQRDPDLAVAQVMRGVQDWSGGTRITGCLHEFNRHWARRVLPGAATVLLITDGLEHGDPAPLAFEAERLHKSCRRLLWLNPLLRFDRFEPRAGGIRAMLPHVDRLLPAHNLDSLEQLVGILAGQGPVDARLHTF
jgi:uncharacterized protein with von Willebrand factor type A (vWA) domain